MRGFIIFSRRNLRKLLLIIFVTCSLRMLPDKGDSLLRIWNTNSLHDTTRAFALFNYSRNLVFNNPDTTLILSRQLLKFAEEHSLKKFMIAARNNMGLSYYVKGEYQQAIDNYSQSVGMLKELIHGEDPELKRFAKTQLGKTYNNIGNVYLNKSDYPLALDFYFQSLKVVEEMNDIRAQSNALGNIGIVYGIQKNYETSIKYLLRSMKMDSLLGDMENIASSYSNISNLYQQDKQLDKALDFQKISLELRTKLGDKGGMVLALTSMGSLMGEFGYDAERKGKPKQQSDDYFREAIAYYEKALVLTREIGEQRNEAVVLAGLGSNMIKLGDAEKGISYCKRSLELAEKVQSDEEVKDACSCLYDGYKLQNNTTKALEYFERFISIRDTLNSADRIREIAQKEFEFDYNKKAAADSLRTMEQRISIQAELKHEQTRRYYLYGGLLLVLIFAGFMVNRYKVSQDQKRIIEKQKTVVEEKQKEILDSIQYAKKIQNTLLAHDDLLNENLNDHFILYRPKDIVSGDFYWATRKGNKFYLAVCDSTGHGVPGAFMSLLNASLLNEAIVEKNIDEPGEVFNYVREKLIGNLSAEAQKDGMDGVLICIDKDTGVIRYAAGNNKPLLISGGQMLELPHDKMPIGIGERQQSFSTYTIDSKKGDHLYLFTDGYADQFGGDKGKKFKHKQLQFKLNEINGLSPDQKKEILNTTFDTWKGMLEQVDDVTIAGIKL
jgi:serine phosphatase RsbU (regulator of sigma subunit)